MDVVVAADAADLARRGAALVAEAARTAIADRGRFRLAVSGGRTPTAMFAALAEEELAWDAVHLFQVDERLAPAGSPDRNAAGLRSALLDRVALPPDHVHLMDVERADLAADLAAAARDYAAVLGRVADGRLDLVHLGLGEDGHTASWPPGDPVVDATDDVAWVGPFHGLARLTLTPPAVNRAGHILWLVEGADKADVLARLRAGDPALPASRVRRSGVTLLADAAAAGGGGGGAAAAGGAD
jgi:6-phosphogluconolactonase